MKESRSMNRKSFFTNVGKGLFLGSFLSMLPAKLFSSVAKTSESKNIKLKVHPSAVKRSSKV